MTNDRAPADLSEKPEEDLKKRKSTKGGDIYYEIDLGYYTIVKKMKKNEIYFIPFILRRRLYS